MGRSKKDKAARRIAAQVAREAPGFVPLPPRWWERLPLIGRKFTARRERRNVLGLKVFLAAKRHAQKKIARIVRS
jgi:hypothetical protein